MRLHMDRERKKFQNEIVMLAPCGKFTTPEIGIFSPVLTTFGNLSGVIVIRASSC